MISTFFLLQEIPVRFFFPTTLRHCKDEKPLDVESEEEDSDTEEENLSPVSPFLPSKNLKSIAARKLFTSSRRSRMRYINSKDPAEIESDYN